MKINNSHLTFIETWLSNGNNATDAYLKAFPTATYTTARTEGSKMLTKPNIKEIIEEKKRELAAKCMITKEELLADLKHIKDLHRDNPKSSNAIKAIEVINKMLGYNMPTEQSISIHAEQQLFSDDDLKPNDK